MSNQIALHRFIANLAHKKRVLLVGNDFELLQLLAMTEVSELVIYDKDADPNAPQGETPLGAPLRFRSDWQERPRSKDLIIDPAGVMSKKDLERLLKKAGVYFCNKKRRLAGFDGTGVEARSLQTCLIGPEAPVETLNWALPESAIQCEPTCDSWLYHRGSFKMIGMAVAHGWGVQSNDKDLDRLAELERLLEEKDRIIEVAKTDLADEKRTHSKLKEAHIALNARLRDRETVVRKLNDDISTLTQDKTELEEENDQLSGVAAKLKADENRFARLNERFQKYQDDSQKEIEALQDELRSLAVPGQDRKVLTTERDALKLQLSNLLGAFDSLFQNALKGKKAPKLPPLKSGLSDAPLKLWLARMEALLSNQQTELSDYKTENQTLRKRVKSLEKKGAQSTASSTVLRGPKTLSVTVSPVTSSKRESQLQALLDMEIERSADLQKSIKTTLKRVEKMAHAYTTLLDQMGALQNAQMHERGLRLAAEADQALLRHELTTKHAELEERGVMLDTYANLQGLLSDSLTQAEEARLDAEDGRRLADENLRILRDEFERMARQELTQ